MAKDVFIKSGKIPPEHEILFGIATGFANVMQSLRAEGHEDNPTIIIEGALTGVSIVAEHYKLHDQVADLMESWAKTLRKREPIIMRFEGEA